MNKEEIHICNYCNVTSGDREVVFPISLYVGTKGTERKDPNLHWFSMYICGACLSKVLKWWSMNHGSASRDLVEGLEKIFFRMMAEYLDPQ